MFSVRPEVEAKHFVLGLDQLQQENVSCQIHLSKMPSSDSVLTLRIVSLSVNLPSVIFSAGVHKLVRSSKFPPECRRWLKQILSLAILNFFFTKAAEFAKESNEKICETVSGVNV